MIHVRFFRCMGYRQWCWTREPLRSGVSTLWLGRVGVHYWIGAG